MSIERIRETIRGVPDFPKPGILFYDITPVLRDKALFAEAVERMAAPYRDNPPDIIVGIESRGFLFAGAMAIALGAGMAPARKKGKLPWKTVSASYALEYGSAEIELSLDAVRPGERVLIADDLIATGGTAAAVASLVKKLGGEVIGVQALIELTFLKGREQLTEYPVNVVFAFD